MWGYKVVRKEGERYFSAIMKKYAKVEYFKNKYSKVPSFLSKTGLTFFKDLENAKRFVTGNNNEKRSLVIYRCRTKGKKESHLYYSPYELDVWKKKDHYCLLWPSGTCFAKEIKLIKEEKT